MRILVLEDEFLIGEEVKTLLQDLGHTVLGPAPNCAAALELLMQEDAPDLALLDAELGADTCEVVVDECRAMDVPMLITSGHAERHLPQCCEGLPYLGKPFSPHHLERAIRAG